MAAAIIAALNELHLTACKDGAFAYVHAMINAQHWPIWCELWLDLCAVSLEMD